VIEQLKVVEPLTNPTAYGASASEAFHLVIVWSSSHARSTDGLEALRKAMSSTNITLFWLTNTAVSAARLYWENRLAYFNPKVGVSVSAAVSASPDELYQAPRNWAEQAYPKFIYYNKLDKGGHFAAWEQPQLLQKRFAPASDPPRKSI
jgi:hypothetical protein